MKINDFINEADPKNSIVRQNAQNPNTYRSDTKPSSDRYVGYEYDSNGNMVYHGGPEKSYRQYNMNPDWVAANPVKARQIAQAFGKSNPTRDVTKSTVRQNKGLPKPETPPMDPVNPLSDKNRAKFGAMSVGDNKSELQKLRDLGYKWSDGSEINPSTERNYGSGSDADTQFVSRVAAGLPTDNTGMTGVGPKQPFTKADQERHADLRFAQRQSTDTGFEYDPQKRFDKKYDRYPVIGNVPKSSYLGKTLNRIKGMFDDVKNNRESIKEDKVSR